MCKYNYKYMDYETELEIAKLMHEGHTNAILAFGLESANAWKEGYFRGLRRSTNITAACVVAIAGAVYLGKKMIDKRREKRYIKFDEATK